MVHEHRVATGLSVVNHELDPHEKKLWDDCVCDCLGKNRQVILKHFLEKMLEKEYLTGRLVENDRGLYFNDRRVTVCDGETLCLVTEPCIRFENEESSDDAVVS